MTMSYQNQIFLIIARIVTNVYFHEIIALFYIACNVYKHYSFSSAGCGLYNLKV